jgi:hypothetical protein
MDMGFLTSQVEGILSSGSQLGINEKGFTRPIPLREAALNPVLLASVQADLVPPLSTGRVMNGGRGVLGMYGIYPNRVPS